MKIGDIVRVTGGKLVAGRSDVKVDPSRISTDTRSIARDSLFIALKGPRFDGSAFVAEALKRGALGVVVERQPAGVPLTDKIVIVVRDTTKALQEIARFHRSRFAIPVIAITGSNGKTTVKDMLSHVLAGRYPVLKTEGTKNNHIGVPQTLLRLHSRHRACVLELGTNHHGEIRALGQIARPTIVVMTNIGPSHLAFLKDLDGVYREKRDILNAFDGRIRGLAVLNGDDPFLRRIGGQRRFTVTRYGLGDRNDFRADALRCVKGRMSFSVNGMPGFTLGLIGTHAVLNALAVYAVARRLGMAPASIRRRLARFRPTEMRLVVTACDGRTIVNDAYNANPLSARAALAAVAAVPANRRWLVSGDMLELGRAAVRLHRELGAAAVAAGIDRLLTFGGLSRHTCAGARAAGASGRGARHCASHDAIAAILRRETARGDLILVKGSRGMRMERVIEKFKSRNA